MSNHIKSQLLNDLEALRHQLSELEAQSNTAASEPPVLESIANLHTDEIPAGDAASTTQSSAAEAAITAHREAIAHLSAKIAEVDAANTTDSLESSLQEIDDELFEMSDEDDPFSPPPNLSANTVTESLMLDIPTLKEQQAEPSLSEPNDTSPELNDAADIAKKPSSPNALLSAAFNDYPPILNDTTFAPLEGEEPLEEQILQAQTQTTLINNASLESQQLANSNKVNSDEQSTDPTSLFATNSTPMQKAVKDQEQLDNELPEFLKAENIMINAEKTPATPEPIGVNNAAEDNPFLPLHLRERLSKSKSSLMEGIARSSESLDASTALLRNVGNKRSQEKPEKPSAQTITAHEHQAVVDTLVAKYLPIIEADLRQKLFASINQTMANDKQTTEATP